MPTDVLDHIDTEEVTRRLMHLLDIKNQEEQRILPEEIILLETMLAFPHLQVCTLQFPVGEFDMQDIHYLNAESYLCSLGNK